MPIRETPWYRVETFGRHQALRNRGGIICTFYKPYHYEGQDERYAKELAEMEGAIALVESAPILSERVRILREALAGILPWVRHEDPGTGEAGDAFRADLACAQATLEATKEGA